ncbi:kiwellin-1-like [Vicia villosa]|uniref:kiwellin-1-like n=1 Tax=Vicia villosa TaxID=3911 RepID=UPI00273B8CD8|nr:kiwellin-1-like [Vicia villosa]
MKIFFLKASFLLLLTLDLTTCVYSETKCRPSGRIKGKKTPQGQCNQENRDTKAYLTLNSFQKGGDAGGLWECDNKYHNDDTPVAALSTGWFNNKSRCLNKITISANAGRSVVAMVFNICDSTMGCDEDHDYQLPRENNREFFL